MAVEIPVVVDIYGALKEAAEETPNAMKALQSAINDNALEVPVVVNKKGDLAEVLDFVGKTELSMDNLKMAIKSVTKELAAMKRRGASRDDIETYSEALTVLKTIKQFWQDSEREVGKIADSELRALQVEMEYESAVEKVARSFNDLNDKMAKYTAMVNNADIGSDKFVEAAIALGMVHKAAEKVSFDIKELGTETGSIDNLNVRIQRLNAQWNQMAASKKFMADGRLTKEAEDLIARGRELTNEYRRQASSINDIINKEDRRAEIQRKVQQQTIKENGILKTTVKTVSVLEAKLSILQRRLSITQAGTPQFAKLNQQLRQTQRELDGIRMSMTGVENENLKMDRTLGNLLKKSAYLFGLHTITRFIQNVREVTSEFEMQRVALGGIISDTEEANMLFRQIKAAAIESPFQIKELVTFTKQLSAYRIETENLFDVTMKLADVSAGLGVDMNRLVLAYGQVRAASVLRGQELRQFTEAGIPLVELLAKKFTDLNGKMVSTADVFELISKRAVPFEMIAEIFDDMTSAGGTFYKMQEKQAETLAGQWSNLKDALSIMYDEIGNTQSVHNAMEGLINDAKFLMQNWRTVATVLEAVGFQFATMKVASLFLPTLTLNTDLARKATMALARAEQLEAAQQIKSSTARKVAIGQLRAYSDQMRKAATAQTLFGRGWYKLAASMAGGGWIGLAITGLTIITGLFASAYKEAHRLERELDKIGSDGVTSVNRSVANFERLANAAVSAADGSDEQNKALAELQRTYGDIIPSQDLQITKLNELKGNYDSLTEAIRQKINMQIQEQKINAATDYYSGKIQRGRKQTKNLLESYGLDKDQINAVLDEVETLVDKGMLNVGTRMNDRAKIIEGVIKKLTGLEVELVETYRYGEQKQFSREVTSKAAIQLSKLVDTYIELDRQQKKIEDDMENAIGTMGVYAASWDNLKGKIKDVTISEEEFGKKHTFAYKKEKIRKEVDLMADAITDAFSGTEIDISDAISGGTIDFGKIVEAAEKAETSTEKYGLTNYIKKIQKSYEAIVPTDQMVGVVEKKFAELAKAAGLSMDDIQGYLYRGNQDIRDYVKDLQSSLQDAEDAVTKLNMVFAAKGFMTLADRDQLTEAESYVEVIKGAIEFLDAFAKKTKTATSRHEQDPFIAQMQERIKFMQDFKKGYDDLRKYLGSTDALSKESDLMLKRGKALGLGPEEQQRAATDLSQWYDDMLTVAFNKAKSKGATGTIESFLSQQITGTSDRAKALKEFQKFMQSLWDAKTDLDTSEMKRNFEEALKRVEDEIKRSEAAKNFYKNILETTGDEDLAANLSVSLYGSSGEDLEDQLREQIQKAFVLDKEKVDADKLDMSDVSEKVRTAIESGNTKELTKYLKYVVDKNQSAAKSVVEAWEKSDQDILVNFAKSIEKYSSLETKRKNISIKARQKIQEAVDASSFLLNEEGLSEEDRERIRKQRDEIIAAVKSEEKLDLFKLSDEYIDYFAEINVMTSEQAALVRGDLRNAYFEAFHDGAIDADILRRNLRAIDEQFKKLQSSSSLLSAYLTGGVDGALAKLQEYSNNVDVISAKMQKGITPSEGEQAYITQMLQMFGTNSEQLRGINSYQQLINTFTKNGKGLEGAGKAFGQIGKGVSAAASNVGGAVAIVDMIVNAVNDSINAVQELIDELNKLRTEENKVGGWYRYLSDFNKYAYKGWNDLKSGNGVGVVMDIANSIISIVNNIKQSKLDKVNDKLKTQTDTIENLDYQYQRLQNSIQNAFGSDYVSNYNKQLEALYAKQEAYEEQARLERSKGKASDSEKIKNYENSAREVGDQILDMQGQLAEFFSGTDLTSAAKDFATAWIDAYKEFGSTTDAMKEKFNSMIQSMIENSLAAKIMQEILDPLFRQIDEMASDSELSTSDIAQIAATAPEYIDKINTAMVTLMNGLTAAGYNIRQQPGQFTGIKRNIANATEESINGLTREMLVNNFYMSHLPAIDANVAQILAIMSGGSAESPTTGASYQLNSDLALQYMSALPSIDEKMADLLRVVKSVISDKNSSSNINVVAVRA